MARKEVKVSVQSREPIAFAAPHAGLEPFFKLERWHVTRMTYAGENSTTVMDSRIIWRRGDFVVAVALTENREVVLVEEYKQAVEEVLLGLPAGGVQKDEDHVAAALRELRQETGYARVRGAPGRTHVVGPLYNSPDKSTERHYVVVITGVSQVGDPLPEASETILAVRTLSYDVARERLPIALHQGALAVAERFLP